MPSCFRGAPLRERQSLESRCHPIIGTREPKWRPLPPWPSRSCCIRRTASGSPESGSRTP
eukprot:8061743-Pyramimonas_sp.AAC.1